MTSSLLMAGCQVSGTLLASHFSFHDKLGRGALIAFCKLPSREGKPRQARTVGPPHPTSYMIALCKMGKGK